MREFVTKTKIVQYVDRITLFAAVGGRLRAAAAAAAAKAIRGEERGRRIMRSFSWPPVYCGMR